MNAGQTVFSQLMDFLPLPEFRKCVEQCVERYRGEYKVQSFSCLDQFLCLAFAQLTYREGLRDIEACLRAQQSKLYHMGFRGKVSRSTLADANEQRDWRIYADFAQSLIATARDLYRHEPFGLELAETVYALDSTTIDLCLTLFPWAQFRRQGTHLAGSSGQHSRPCLRDGKADPRCQLPRPTFARTRRILRPRSWLFGLPAALLVYPSLGFLYHPGAAKYPVLPSPVRSHRQIHRLEVRPNHPAHRPQNLDPLS